MADVVPNCAIVCARISRPQIDHVHKGGMVTSLHLEGIGMTSQRTRQRLVQRLQEQGIQNQKVLDTLLATPRHIFLDEALSHRAYEDTALPIGYAQTLSQPYIVAKMTEVLLESEVTLDKVLEVGTGSGYQTTVLAQLVKYVYSVERIKPLQDKARNRLKQLKLRNVELRHADGGFGWPERGPFNAIMSTAAPREVPQELLAQLAPNGVLIIPVGEDEQHLCRIRRLGDGNQFESEVLEPVRFVPLLSGVTR